MLEENTRKEVQIVSAPFNCQKDPVVLKLHFPEDLQGRASWTKWVRGDI